MHFLNSSRLFVPKVKVRKIQKEIVYLKIYAKDITTSLKGNRDAKIKLPEYQAPLRHNKSSILNVP